MFFVVALSYKSELLLFVHSPVTELNLAKIERLYQVTRTVHTYALKLNAP